MSHSTPLNRPQTNTQVSHRIPLVAAALGCTMSATGWGLEWYRQRGTCDIGDKAPDTLALSVILIVVGGGLIGAFATASALVVRRRAPLETTRPALLLATAAFASFLAIFLFAGAGPGAWFQYCAS